MTQVVRLDPVPNQEFSTYLDGVRWDIGVKEAADSCMVFTFSRNGVLLISGKRAVCNELLLPYRHLESGNFYVSTPNDEIPDYAKFDSTHILVYGSQAEVDEARANG